jgi:hypothetical protein
MALGLLISPRASKYLVCWSQTVSPVVGLLSVPHS